MTDIPKIKVYKVWNVRTKRFYFSSRKSIFSSKGHIKSSMSRPPNDIEDWYLITLSSTEPITILPLKIIFK